MKTQCSSSCPEGFDHGVPDPGEHVLITEIEGHEGDYPFGVIGHALYSGAGGCDLVAWPDGGRSVLLVKDARIHWLPIDDESTPDFDELTATHERWLAPGWDGFVSSGGVVKWTWTKPADTRVAWFTHQSEAELRAQGVWQEGDYKVPDPHGTPSWMHPEAHERPVVALPAVSDLIPGLEAVPDSDTATFPTDDFTLDALEQALNSSVRIEDDGTWTRVGSEYGLHELLEFLSGYDATRSVAIDPGVEDSELQIFEYRGGSMFHVNDVVRALIAEVRRLRA